MIAEEYLLKYHNMLETAVLRTLLEHMQEKIMIAKELLIMLMHSILLRNFVIVE